MYIRFNYNQGFSTAGFFQITHRDFFKRKCIVNKAPMDFYVQHAKNPQYRVLDILFCQVSIQQAQTVIYSKNKYK